MNLISSVERSVNKESSGFGFEASRCLRSLDKYSSCEICVELCPVEAIQLGNPPGLIPERCENCLACTTACPTEAFFAESELRSLLFCAARLGGRSISLLCQKNPIRNMQVSDAEVTIQIRNCLAGLSTGAYLSLLVMGVEKVFVRLDACNSCNWSNASSQIHKEVSLANRLMLAAGRSDRIETIETHQLCARSNTPIWNVNNPPITRKELFQLAATLGKVTEVQSLSDAAVPQDVKVPRERRRMANAFKNIARHLSNPKTSLEGFPFATIQVSEACTACSACSRVCPSGAIRYIEDEDDMVFHLVFNPVMCNGCQACIHVCFAKAIQIDNKPTVGEVFADRSPHRLRVGLLRRCGRCLMSFASKSGVDLCPACEYRRNNPFLPIPPQLLPKKTALR